MAEYFSITRPYLSDDLLMLKKYLKSNSKILDLGCGNGRLVQLVEKKDDIDYIGIDISKQMIEIAKKNNPQKQFVLQEDPLKINFKNESFDQVFCLSVFHHIPSHDFRIEYLKEIKRVIKQDGNLVMLNWNLKARKGIKLKIFIDYLKNKGLDFKDIYLPFKNERGKILTQRYIHCFSQKELDCLYKETGFQIQKSKKIKRGKKISNSNFLHILRKR